MNSRFEQPAPSEESAPEAEETQAIERPTLPEEPAKEVDFAAVRKALEILESDQEFNTFFKGYGDSAEFNLAKNHREFFARYEIFQAKKEVEQKLGELYVKDIEQALNLPLSEEGGKVLSEFLDKEAKENPEGLKERLLQIKNYEQLKKRKEELESQVDKLFSKEEKQEAINQLKAREKEQVELTEKARWFVGWRGQINLKNWTTIGWLFRSKEETELRKRIWDGKSEWSAWIGTPAVFLENFEKKLKEIQEKTQRIESLSARQEEFRLFFKEQRVNFFAGLLGARKLLDVFAQRVGEQLTFLIFQGEKEKDLKRLEEARSYFAQARTVGEELGIDLFKKIQPEEAESYLSEKIDVVVASLLKERLSEMKTSNQALKAVQGISQSGGLEPKGKETIVAALKGGVEEGGQKIEKQEKPKRKRVARVKKEKPKEVGIDIKELPQDKLSELLKMILEKGLLITIEGAKIKVQAPEQR